MLPVVASCCVTPEATTTWRCREVPVFGLCICGHGNSANVNTESHTESDNMMELKTDSWDAPMILMPIVSSWITAILPGFSSEEKSNLTSIDGWGSPGLSDFPVKFCWGNKVWRSKWISQSTILNVCLKNSVESKSKSLQKVNEDWCLHHLKMHGYMALVPGCWLSLAIDMTSSTHTSLASIQL